MYGLANASFIKILMNSHNMFVDGFFRAVINCSLPLFHGLCIL